MPEAFICDAVRTPIGRYAGGLAKVRTDDLAAIPIKALMKRYPNADWAALDEVVEHYDRGGIDRPSRSVMITPLHLTTQEKHDLVAFMLTLTSEAEPTTVPLLPR